MFCHQCGQPLPTGGKFCPHCGTPAAQPATAAVSPAVTPTPLPTPAAAPVAAAAVMTVAAPPAAPAYWTPPPAVAVAPAPPVMSAASPAVTAAPGAERLIYYESAVRTKVPGRSFWNHDILVTESRLIARKTGWKGNLTKGMARSAAGGLVNAVAAVALYSLDFGMSKVKTPKFDDAPVVPSADIDEFRDKADGAVEFRFGELTQCVFRKRGFITPATLVLRGPAGELLTEVNFLKELKPILRQMLGARCSEE